MSRPERLPNQTRVRFDIAQGLATGAGVIAGARYDDGWLYRLDQVHGTGPVDEQRNERGELWAWDFEVAPDDPGAE